DRPRTSQPTLAAQPGAFPRDQRVEVDPARWQVSGGGPQNVVQAHSGSSSVIVVCASRARSVSSPRCLALHRSHGTKKPENSRVDAAIKVLACATVVGLAGIAAAISFSHMHELVIRHGESGWRGHAFPLSVDGIELTASLVLLAHRRAGTRAGVLPWAAL